MRRATSAGPRRRPALLGVVAAGLCLTTAACSGSGSTPADPRDGVPTGTSATPVATSAPTSGSTTTLPLTGQAAASPDAATRAVVAVPVEAGSGLPAVAGTGDADLVYVAFPTAGRQRALALFQSRDAARVGPIGDVRPLDTKLLRAISAVLEHSGGTSGFIKQVARADLPEWSSIVQPSSFSRDPATGAVFGSTTAARAATGVQPARPGLLAFSAPGTAPATAATPPPAVQVAVAGQPAASLSYDAASGTWRGSVGGFAVAASNVLVQQVTYDTLVLPKTGGRTEGNPDPDGQGAATLLSGPTVDTGSWNRPGGGTSTKYVRADGTPLRLLPGTTWVLLVPTGTPVTAP